MRAKDKNDKGFNGGLNFFWCFVCAFCFIFKSLKLMHSLTAVPTLTACFSEMNKFMFLPILHLHFSLVYRGKGG